MNQTYRAWRLPLVERPTVRLLAERDRIAPTGPGPHHPANSSFVVEAADGRVVTVSVERARVPVVVAWVPRWLASVVVVVGPVVLSAALILVGTQ